MYTLLLTYWSIQKRALKLFHGQYWLLLYLLWVCLPPLLLVRLVWSPPETPVRAFLIKVKKPTISCSRPTRAAQGSQPHPLQPPRAGRYHPGRGKRFQLLGQDARYHTTTYHDSGYDNSYSGGEPLFNMMILLHLYTEYEVVTHNVILTYICSAALLQIRRHLPRIGWFLLKRQKSSCKECCLCVYAREKSCSFTYG